jgi:hypothetical protein
VTEATSIAEVAPPWEDEPDPREVLKELAAIPPRAEVPAAFRMANKTGEPWRWTTGRVVTQAQVDHIIRQAEFAGGRAAWFLAECIDAGIIREGRLCRR